MARRQVVLQPVDRQLNLPGPWFVLRNQVSAQVPPQNLRLVTVTVLGTAQDTTNAIANAIVDQLVTLSPSAPDGNQQQFVNQQAESLKATIEDTQDRIANLKVRIGQSTDPTEQNQLSREMLQAQNLLVEWQKNYVDLISADPTADAGGLQVLDEASPVTNQGRPGVVKQGLVGAFVGAMLGLVLAWLLHGRETRRRALPSRRQAYDPDTDGYEADTDTYETNIDGYEAGKGAWR
jgi:capsular polysaccharide biosynthesis protein